MFKILLSFIFIFLITLPVKIYSSEDSISQFTYGYLKRVNDFLSDGDYENAERELSILSKRYFLNFKS